jgi:hypothetical protein
MTNEVLEGWCKGRADSILTSWKKYPAQLVKNLGRELRDAYQMGIGATEKSIRRASMSDDELERRSRDVAGLIERTYFGVIHPPHEQRMRALIDQFRAAYMKGLRGEDF